MRNFFFDKFENPLTGSKNIACPFETITEQMEVAQNYFLDMLAYMNEFAVPYFSASQYFTNVEKEKILTNSPLENLHSYVSLADMNLDLTARSFLGVLKAISTYGTKDIKDATDAFLNTVFEIKDGETLKNFMDRKARMIHLLTNVYPKAIKESGKYFGFHFEQGRDIKVAETDRFIMYQVMPTIPGVEVNTSCKPVLILPPYVLGPNILAFLPDEQRSYVHSFSNKGIPTYIRIMKNIKLHEAVQIMTPEDDVNDTFFFCKKIKENNGKMVTLNGYCQGGFFAFLNIASGKLDGLADALITCVAPIDGSLSVGLNNFLKSLPPRFNKLEYGAKALPNGIKVADGDIMAWVYKLKSIELEFPLVALYRDMSMFDYPGNENASISKTAAALNYWLTYEKTDLPMDITRMSFLSYNNPIKDDGTTPITLFDKKIDFRYIKEKGIKWLICYGENDDLVEKDSALAPLKYCNAEVAAFPKGHVAIATSWSHPDSKYALHKKFDNNKGPVFFQLELDSEAPKK
ncbi:metal transporter [Desulforegula conservatrix]|uniref:metal transporter n=1 Tax=Desulforegula conservatrix TaxID=153026 RepID=UPI000427C60F|nr:metal transporter [Desulforegula conservatrix]